MYVYKNASDLLPTRGESYPFDCLLPFAKIAGETFPAFGFLSAVVWFNSCSCTAEIYQSCIKITHNIQKKYSSNCNGRQIIAMLAQNSPQNPHKTGFSNSSSWLMFNGIFRLCACSILKSFWRDICSQLHGYGTDEWAIHEEWNLKFYVTDSLVQGLGCAYQDR